MKKAEFLSVSEAREAIILSEAVLKRGNLRWTWPHRWLFAYAFYFATLMSSVGLFVSHDRYMDSTIEMNESCRHVIVVENDVGSEADD